MIQQRAVRLDDQVIEDIHTSVQIAQPQVLKVGKRRFLRLLPGE